MSAVHFRNEFGSQRVYAVTAPADEKAAGKRRASGSYIGNRLFGQDVSYADLVSAVLRGRRVTSTTLTDEFSWEAYQHEYGEERMPLFVVDKQGVIRPFTGEDDLQPGKGSEIIALEREEQPARERDSGSSGK